MRVRIIREPDATSSLVRLVVQRWNVGQWENVMNFELGESEQAHEFAMKLSMSKRVPNEIAQFEDGKEVGGFEPVIMPLRSPRPAMDASEETPEN